MRRSALLRLLLAAAAAGGAVALATTASDGSDGPAPDARSAVRPLIDPEAAPARVSRRPPVIMLIFDEWPPDAMLGRDGRIDPVRYPNLAALAATGYWFPNASTVYDSTPKAIPVLMDGRRPREGVPSTPKGHPRTIFDFFGRRGYRIVASEEATAVCPRRWCGGRGRRPSLVKNLQGGRVTRLRRFFRGIRPGGRPGFYLKHVLLPHVPWQFLPSGRRTRNGPRDPIPGMGGVPGFDDPFLTQHNQQRQLLQIGFVDHELGLLFGRLRRNGMLDRSMIVVVADHGFSWDVGVNDRRKVTAGNVDEVAPVPLFIKAPGQRRGRTVRSYVTTLDVVPTIADLLGRRLPYRADGRSAFSRTVRRRRFVRLPTRFFERIIRISARAYERRRRANVRRRLRLFGAGATGLFTGIGPNRGLLGKRVAELPRAAAGRVRGSIAAARELRAVRRASGLVPTQIAGSLRGGRRRQRRDIAVAVNGRIEAVGRSFYLRRRRTEHFAVNVPEAALRDGRNTVEVFEVARGGTLRPLARG